MRKKWFDKFNKAGMVIISCLIFFEPKVVCAAAWTLPQGEGLTITAYSFYHSDRFVTMSGKRSSQPAFQKFSVSSYMEYGWREAVTLGGSARLISARQENNSSAYSLSEAEFFFRHRILAKDHWVVSYQPMLRIPGVADGNDSLLGIKTTDVELRLLAVYEPSILQSFINAEMAYRLRSRVSDEWRTDLTIGVPMTDKTDMLLQGFGTLATSSLSHAASSVVNSSQYHLVKGQASVVHRLSEVVSVQAGLTCDVWGRNIGLGHGVFTALWYRF